MPIKVLIVDDSPTMRAVVKAVLRSDPDIEIVGEAGDPLEAREAIKRLNPDVLTLDIEMPKMDGIAFLEKIMKLRPMPVIMVSTLTQQGAQKTIQALSLGAFDCIGKPAGGDFVKELAPLRKMVHAASQYRPKGMAERKHAEQNIRNGLESYKPNNKIIAIGSSTGGVEALMTLLMGFPENCPPTLITQHMPPSFLQSFSQRLDQAVLPKVACAVEGSILKTGHVYFAPGGQYHMKVAGRVKPMCQLLESDPVSGHRPSVDVMMGSVCKVFGDRAIGVILTGMGRDGAEGMVQIKQAGGQTIGQNRASSTVYGMARTAKEKGGVELELPLTEISKKLMQWSAC